jgi:hypothetical protein
MDGLAGIPPQQKIREGEQEEHEHEHEQQELEHVFIDNSTRFLGGILVQLAPAPVEIIRTPIVVAAAVRAVGVV